MTYEEKKYKLSAEIAVTHSEYKLTGTGFVLFERLAEEEIARQVKAIREFYNSTFHDGDFLIQDWLIKNGYIPEKEEE